MPKVSAQSVKPPAPVHHPLSHTTPVAAEPGLAYKSHRWSPSCYLPQLIKTAELDPSQNYIAGFHPHGVMAAGAFLNLCTESTGFSSLFPGIRSYLMTLPLWFRAPFLRDYIMSVGESPTQNQVAQEGTASGCAGGSGRELSTVLQSFQVLV